MDEDEDGDEEGQGGGASDIVLAVEAEEEEACYFSELKERWLDEGQKSLVQQISSKVRQQIHETTLREQAWRVKFKELEDCNEQLRQRLVQLQQQSQHWKDFYQTMRFMSLAYRIKKKLGPTLFFAVGGAIIIVPIYLLIKNLNKSHKMK